MPNDDENITLILRVPKHWHEFLKEQARLFSTDISVIVRAVLYAKFKKHGMQPALQKRRGRPTVREDKATTPSE